MDLTRALAHLNRIGVTRAVLIAGNVDPNDPAAVRAEVEMLLRSALAEHTILYDTASVTRLQLALSALLTPVERATNEVFALVLRRDLVGSGVLVPVASEFEGCLADGASA